MTKQQKRLYKIFRNKGPMPLRKCVCKGHHELAQTDNDGDVAITGNGGIAKAKLGGAAIAGDGATATCSGMMALAGENGWAAVGDGSMARVGYRGRASGEFGSVSYAHPEGWALSIQTGIALALGGLAETKVEGIAATYSLFTSKPMHPSLNWRGIALAGPGGIAVAMTEGSFVQAGIGGALLGIWKDGENGMRVAVRRIRSTAAASAIYRFAKGRFVRIRGQDLADALADIEKWRKAGPWKGKPRGRRKKTH